MKIISEFMLKIDNMRFDNIDDFFIKKASIQSNFEKLEYEEKEMYKWYFFYQMQFIKEPLLDCCWDYVNNLPTIQTGANKHNINNLYSEFCIKRAGFFRGKSKD